jgi:hypothetical protein
LIALLGGGAVISAAAGAWVGGLVAKRIAHGWEHKHQRDLEAYKAESERDRSVLSAVIQSHSAGQAAATERRLVAVEALWSTVRLWRDESGVPLLFFGILVPSEYNDHTPQMRARLDSLNEDNLHAFSAENDKLELHRPFLGERLWLLFWVYRAFLGRLTYKLIKGYEAGDIRDWREDKPTVDLLRGTLSDAEMATVLESRLQAAQLVVDQLEHKMLTEMNRVVSGESRAEESFQHARKVRELITSADRRAT